MIFAENCMKMKNKIGLGLGLDPPLAFFSSGSSGRAWGAEKQKLYPGGGGGGDGALVSLDLLLFLLKFSSFTNCLAEILRKIKR